MSRPAMIRSTFLHDNSCATFVDLLRRRALEGPGDAAYTFLADGEAERGAVTYGELDRQARALAATMQSYGLTGERALLLFPPGLEYVTALFGCLYAGVVAVPAYPPRRNRSVERFHTLLADARVAAVLTAPSVGPAVERLAEQVPGLPRVPRLITGRVAGAAADAWREPSLSDETLALLQYTSGSTAAPRGVMLTHRNLLHNCHWIRQRFQHSPDSRGVIWLPPYHDMGLIGGILEALYLGAHCYLMSPVTVFSSPFAWLQAISRFRATTSGGPNFAYDLCVRKVTPEQRAALDLSCWKVAFSGAEPVRAETMDRFAAAFGPCGFRKDAFYPCYGLAEATLLVAGGRANTPPRTLVVRRAELEQNRVHPSHPGEAGCVTVVGCGQTLDDQDLAVVHPERSTRCPPGEIGEVWVAGPSVAKGYWGRPEESRQTFGARLADTGEGPYLRTGDLGFLQDGELYITGRLKDLIILRGRNLYPQDIEQTAEASHTALQPGAVAAFAVDEDGQERLVIAAEVIPRRQPELAAVADAVRRAVADEHEADLHAFVLLRPGGLPKTSSGKVRRRACR
ncbi:MAG TPA: fatty acyl-AMP ligase, partial [Gemmataceae bacterium]